MIELSELKLEFHLRAGEGSYGKNTPVIWIAPRSANVKIDRVVLYQADRKTRALDPATPQSEYDPGELARPLTPFDDAIRTSGQSPAPRMPTIN